MSEETDGESEQVQDTEFQYAVKAICGSVAPRGAVMAPGQYFTAINVHNPSPRTTVPFRWKFALAPAGPGVQPGSISPFSNEVQLRPDQAVEIDCQDIRSLLPVKVPFIKGFVVIETSHELDVVAVYTAAFDERVESIDIERVPPRQITPCGELELTLNTGQAQWEVAQEPAGPVVPPRTADVIVNPYRGWSTFDGTQWIGPSPQAGSAAPIGLYQYRFCFCLCSGFRDAELTLRVYADNRLTRVWLNTSSISFTPVPPNQLPYQVSTEVETDDQSAFIPGENCITLEVQNDPGSGVANPSGVDIRGRVTATSGGCGGV